MKKVFKTLSAILLATACLGPGLAWADGNPSVALEQSGALRASDINGVHSVLVEVAFVGGDSDKITDVALMDVPANALGSAVYVAAEKKAVIAVSAGNAALNLNDSLLGNIDVIAQDASAQAPVAVDAKLTSLEFIDTADSSAATKSGSVNPNAIVRLTSTESVTPPLPENVNPGTPQGRIAEPENGGSSNTGDEGNGNGNGGNAVGDNGNGNGNGGIVGDGGAGNGNGGGNNGNGGSDGTANDGGIGSGNGAGANTTTAANYKANGVVPTTQAGQSTVDAGTGLVKTGDVMLICGLGIGIAAAVVFIAMGFIRKKESARK